MDLKCVIFYMAFKNNTGGVGMFALRATVLQIGHGSFDDSIIASCGLLAQSFHAVSVPLSRKSNFNV